MAALAPKISPALQNLSSDILGKQEYKSQNIKSQDLFDKSISDLSSKSQSLLGQEQKLEKKSQQDLTERQQKNLAKKTEQLNLDKSQLQKQLGELKQSGLTQDIHKQNLEAFKKGWIDIDTLTASQSNFNKLKMLESALTRQDTLNNQKKRTKAIQEQLSIGGQKISQNSPLYEKIIKGLENE